MATGIIFGPRQRFALRIIRRLEQTFADFAEVTDVGLGPHEDRPEFRAILRRYHLRYNVDGRFAIEFLTQAARTRFAALLAALQAKAAQERDADEQDVVDLPAEETLDETWNGGA